MAMISCIFLGLLGDPLIMLAVLCTASDYPSHAFESRMLGVARMAEI